MRWSAINHQLLRTGLSVSRRAWERRGSQTGRLRAPQDFATEIPFGGQYGYVTKKELNLFQLATTRVAELRTCSPEVMRSKMIQFQFRGALSNRVPDDILGDSFSPRGSVTTDCPEDPARSDIGGSRPPINSGFHPKRHRNGSNVTTLPDEIHDRPVPPALSANHRS